MRRDLLVAISVAAVRANQAPRAVSRADALLRMTVTINMPSRLKSAARDACFQRPHPKADFLARVEDSFKPDPLAQPSQAVIAVFELLSKKISRGEIDDVRHALPEEVRTLWPEPYVSAGMMQA
jgi:uncharacterized protein DUF2267